MRFNAEHDISSLGMRTGDGMRWDVSAVRRGDVSAVAAVVLGVRDGWVNIAKIYRNYL